jgi:hypothetical protein
MKKPQKPLTHFQEILCYRMLQKSSHFGFYLDRTFLTTTYIKICLHFYTYVAKYSSERRNVSKEIYREN